MLHGRQLFAVAVCPVFKYYLIHPVTGQFGSWLNNLTNTFFVNPNEKMWKI